LKKIVNRIKNTQYIQYSPLYKMKYQSTIASFGLILASTEIVSSFVQTGTPSISLRSRQQCNTDHDDITNNSNNNMMMRNSKTSLSIATSDIVGDIVEDLKKKKTREVRFGFIFISSDMRLVAIIYNVLLVVVDYIFY
ncbi:MAG: hypothetical protein ACI8RD_011823, partial [Bacillariaceae sp.]